MQTIRAAVEHGNKRECPNLSALRERIQTGEKIRINFTVPSHLTANLDLKQPLSGAATLGLNDKSTMHPSSLVLSDITLAGTNNRLDISGILPIEFSTDDELSDWQVQPITD